MVYRTPKIDMAERLTPSSRNWAKRLIASAALLATLLTASTIAADLSDLPDELDRRWQATADRLIAQTQAAEEQTRLAAIAFLAELAADPQPDEAEIAPPGGIGSSMPLKRD